MAKTQDPAAAPGAQKAVAQQEQTEFDRLLSDHFHPDKVTRDEGKQKQLRDMVSMLVRQALGDTAAI